MPNHEHSPLQSFLNKYLESTKSDLNPEESRNAQGLAGETGEGYEALQYLLGNKKKEVETFYDKHPAQAVGQDFINSAPALGVGAIAAKGGHSVVKDYLLNRSVDKAKKSTGKKDGLKPLSSEDFEKRPDLQHVFQKHHPDKVNPEGMDDFAKEQAFNYEKDIAHQRTATNRASLGETYNTMSSVKNNYPKFNKLDDARIARLMGKNLPKNFNTKEPGSEDTLRRSVEQLFEKDHTHADKLTTESLQKKKDLETPLKAFGKELPISKGKAHNAAEHFVHPDTLKGENWKSMEGVKGLMGKNKLMTAAGGAIVGGMALSPIVNFLQRKIYGDKQTQEWMKNKRMTEGRFE